MDDESVVKGVLIVGARGLGKEIAGYISASDDYSLVGFLDELETQDLLGYPVYHPDRYEGDCRDAIFAIGYPHHKPGILEKYAHCELNWITYIHPAAVVSPFATIGVGCTIAPFAVIAGDCCLSDFVHCGSHAALGHDVQVDAYSSIMPQACIAGGAHLGRQSLVAIGAKILPDMQVGEMSRVSAGAIVTKNIPEKVIAFGNPVKTQPDVLAYKSSS